MKTYLVRLMNSETVDSVNAESFTSDGAGITFYGSAGEPVAFYYVGVVASVTVIE